MIHIKRNICLVAVSCTLLAGIPLQGVAQTGRMAKVQATQSNKITVSGTVLDKTTNDPLIGVSVREVQWSVRTRPCSASMRCNPRNSSIADSLVVTETTAL